MKKFVLGSLALVLVIVACGLGIIIGKSYTSQPDYKQKSNIEGYSILSYTAIIVRLEKGEKITEDTFTSNGYSFPITIESPYTDFKVTYYSFADFPEEDTLFPDTTKDWYIVRYREIAKIDMGKTDSPDVNLLVKPL